MREVCTAIEHQKTLFCVALANDNLKLSIAIRDQVSVMANRVELISFEQNAHSRRSQQGQSMLQSEIRDVG